VTDTLHELLRSAAERHGDRPAVRDGDRSLSYAQLDRASDRLAQRLAAGGVAPGDRVGLHLPKSLEAVIGVYGVLKAGAAYVPLDDAAPAARLAYIATNAGMRTVVTSPAGAAGVERLVAEGAPVRAEVVDAGEAENGAGPAHAPDVPADPDARAYVLYTSGSTGTPKGVMLSHRNGLAFAEWAAREVGVRPEDRLSSHAPLHFDLSTFDLFSAAAGAACVVLVPREASVFPSELARLIRESGITVWYSVPSVLTLLVLRGGIEEEPLAGLRTVIFAGEVFPTKYLVRLMDAVPQARILNFFGPTETNVCTWYDVPRGEPLGDALPIGRAIGGVTATIEDGELVIAGPTVMQGYWGDPERSARVLTERGGVRAYRTGDLVRPRPNGDLDFLGRRDNQIKTRGYRVELGDVEAALHGLDVVVEAAVVAVPDDALTNRLRAYVVTSTPVGAAEIAKRCRERLPGYMVPDEFEFRVELPKSSTGKVDRRALHGL
jgi:amino acid adenylation domain-containing protein